MFKRFWISALSASLVLACGGKTNDQGDGGTGGAGATGGSGATGGGGSGGAVGGTGGAVGGTGGAGAVAGSGGSGGMPTECAVETSQPGPYAVKFRFTNSSTPKLFLRQDCMLNWSLHSCADGYSTSIAHAADCMSECTDPTSGCLACGACMLNALEVTPGNPVETDWGGFTYSFSQNASGCECYNKLVAPAGKYSISIPVFTSEQDAQSGTPAWEASVEFAIPTKAMFIEVPLDPPLGV